MLLAPVAKDVRQAEISIAGTDLCADALLKQSRLTSDLLLQFGPQNGNTLGLRLVEMELLIVPCDRCEIGGVRAG